MKDDLLQKPYNEKLFDREAEHPEGSIVFEEPDRETDGEFLGKRARINDEELDTFMEERKELPIIVQKTPRKE